jgi:hypothetical protein
MFDIGAACAKAERGEAKSGKVAKPNEMNHFIVKFLSAGAPKCRLPKSSAAKRGVAKGVP